MSKTEIKKALYKQKPIATWVKSNDKGRIYMAHVNVDLGDSELFSQEVYFEIPKSELKDIEGNNIFKYGEPAQLLIRWLI